MAHVPTFRTLANMKAKEIPSYLVSHASVGNLRGFWRDWNTYYYSKFVQKPNRAPLLHAISFCRYACSCYGAHHLSLVQLLVVTPYHAWKHNSGHGH
jgi:hypothetical protein